MRRTGQTTAIRQSADHIRACLPWCCADPDSNASRLVQQTPARLPCAFDILERIVLDVAWCVFPVACGQPSGYIPAWVVGKRRTTERRQVAETIASAEL